MVVFAVSVIFVAWLFVGLFAGVVLAGLGWSYHRGTKRYEDDAGTDR